MANKKQTQIPLVSSDGSTPQPPFPGGWVLAMFAALDHFLGKETELPIKDRTKVRINQGEAVKQATHKRLVDVLASLVGQHFPAVASVEGFARTYCDEYFRCWTVAVEIAPHWARGFGYETESSAILARALIRDLALRLAYLESCNRALTRDDSLAARPALFRFEGPRALHASMLQAIRQLHGDSLEATALGLSTNDSQLRRIRRGEAVPTWSLWEEIAGPEIDLRLLAGTGWLHTLMHRFGLNDGPVGAELFAMADAFFPSHAFALGQLRLQDVGFDDWMRTGKNLLLHPGFDLIWHKMPSALWRAHLYNLQFARMPDLAHAYVQFGRVENYRDLNGFFEVAEKNSKGCPYGWMDELRHRKTIIPFSNLTDTT